MSQPFRDADYKFGVLVVRCCLTILLALLLAAPAAAFGVRPGSDEGQTRVRPGSDEGQTHTGTVTGHVVDARTGAGLARVMVEVDGGPSTLTDDAGSFLLAPVSPGSRRVRVSVVGYVFVHRDVTVTAGAAIDLVIPLTEGTGTYTETLTVTADPFRAAEPAVAAQQALGSAELQNLRGVLADDPLRAVQVLPGVTTGDDLRSEFSVRGSGFSRMNMTVDGFSTPFLLHTVRAVEDYSGSGSVAMINSDILEEVTLLNGSYAQRFGNRTGAELDFRLREGSRDRTQTRVAVSGTNASAVFEGPIGSAKRGSWLVTARQSYLDLIVDRLVEEGLHFQFSDTQAKFVLDATPRHRFELALLAGTSRLQQIPDEEVFYDYLETARNASGLAIGAWRVSLPRGILTSRALFALNTFRNDARSDANLDKGRDRQSAVRSDLLVNVRPALDVEAGVQADWTVETRTRHRYSSMLGRYRVINDYDGDALRTGGYAQLRWTPRALTLVPGARVDRWSLTNETRMSPWVQAEWKLTSSLAVRGGAGVYRQFPDFEQVVGALAATNPRSERAVQYDAGLEQRLGNAFRWQATLYDREEDGFMTRPGLETRLVNGRVVRGATTARYSAALDGYSRGVELLVQRRSPNGLAGWLAYSYGRNRYVNGVTGESFWGDLDQRHTFNAYGFYRKSDRVSFSAKLRLGSNVPAPGYYTERDGLYFLSTSRNDMRLPFYSRVDLRANRTYTWGNRRLTLFAEVINLLNRDNVRFNPPWVDGRTGQLSNPFERMVPIVPSVGFLLEL